MHKIGNFSEFLRGEIGNFSATSIPAREKKACTA